MFNRLFSLHLSYCLFRQPYTSISKLQTQESVSTLDFNLLCATTFSASSFKQEAEKQNNPAKNEAHQTLNQKECGLFPNTSGVDHIKSYEADMRSGHCDLSYPPLGVSTNRQRVSTSQQHAAYVCRSCAIVLLLLSSDEPLSPNDTMRKRSHCYFHISEPHLPTTHTCPLFLIAHEKPSSCPKGICSVNI